MNLIGNEFLINNCADFGLDGFGQTEAHAGNMGFAAMLADE